MQLAKVLGGISGRKRCLMGVLRGLDLGQAREVAGKKRGFWIQKVQPASGHGSEEGRVVGADMHCMVQLRCACVARIRVHQSRGCMRCRRPTELGRDTHLMPKPNLYAVIATPPPFAPPSPPCHLHASCSIRASSEMYEKSIHPQTHTCEC
jgi:hypothetical protein